MPVPHRNAGGFRRFPGQRRQPAPPDRQRAGLHHPDRAVAQRQAPRTVGDRSHGHGRQCDRHAGTVSPRTVRHPRRRRKRCLALAGRASAYAQARQAARRTARHGGGAGRPVGRRLLGPEALMTAAIILALAALVFVAGAALLWRQAGQGQRRKATSVFLERQLSQASQTGESADRDTDRSPMAVVRSGIEQWDVLLRCAGIRQTPGFYIAIAGLLAAAVLLAALFAGAVSAIVAAVVVLVGVYFSISLRADKRRQRMFDQLPEMLEAMVRLITIGNSMAAAFQAASANTNEPLREVVEKAAQL